MVDKIHRGTFALGTGNSGHDKPAGGKAVKSRRNRRHGKTGIVHLQVNHARRLFVYVRLVHNHHRAFGGGLGYVAVAVGVQARQGKEKAARLYFSGIVFQPCNQGVGISPPGDQAGLSGDFIDKKKFG